MRIGAKTDYALRAALELAANDGERPVKAEAIATAQQIPPRFLEKILNDLRRAGIVESRRGVEGGHLLASPADEIAVADVIRAIDGPLANVSGKRPHELSYDGAAEKLPELLVAARAALRDVLDRTTLADVVSGQLPDHVTALAGDPAAWSKRG
ncbi:RrF2 family transcriptional regulator [Conexibacter woesei]|uniref:Transcriptional regulator, BadM/Rrf2 family n=1 Tax=Conexibacter woesei (strain DSM 14684 / CCUG 47730 / CIP 108061 / JCM 11494 / NBRC 100937 / ID131577) TaxID=469383 RepID=D3FES4_CONWI|nr:Rrf2 family transcriptional regulator [Conexibacter woesei]ADB49748.1 transcriptional regulator, BadM/Rrf2 family [Conexibacter woesei DSM 14684]